MNKKRPIKQSPKKDLAAPKSKRDYTIIFLWVIIGVVSIIRYRLIDVPFERDEGEYGYIGNLLLHGIAPFKNAYSMKLPGTAFMYSIFMVIFGHTNTGVHLGLIFMNAATMYFLFATFRKIFNPFLGFATAGIYGFMAVGLVFDGFAAHATHFICFYSSIALLFLAGFIKSGKTLKIFLCGLMFGMAFLMKQQAVFLILFGALFLFIYLKTDEKQNLLQITKKLLLYSSGVIIPYAIVILIILLTGQFRVFWLWTVDYASKYESVKSFDQVIQFFKGSFIPDWTIFYYFWILALVGIFAVFQNSYTRLQKLFVVSYFIASACVVSAGFYFRTHYFIVLLPAIGLLTGMAVEFIIKLLLQRIKVFKSPNAPLIILSVLILFTVYVNSAYYFSDTTDDICNTAYPDNPFNVAQDISKYIHDNTTDTDKIAVLGSEPEIYFYAGRMAATGYLYTYPLVEKQPYNLAMQNGMIQEIEKNKPAYVVLVFCNYSWLAQDGTPRKIFTWLDSYCREHYTPTGFGDFFTGKGWQFYWDDDIKKRIPQAESLVILKRNKEI